MCVSFSNTELRVAVSTLDFPLTAFGPEFYLLINDLYVFSARPLDGFPQGYIGVSERQRMWARIAVTDSVRAQIYNPFNQERKAYLGSTDIEIAFAGKSRTEEQYDQNELGNSVREVSRYNICVLDDANFRRNSKTRFWRLDKEY